MRIVGAEDAKEHGKVDGERVATKSVPSVMAGKGFGNAR